MKSLIAWQSTLDSGMNYWQMQSGRRGLAHATHSGTPWSPAGFACSLCSLFLPPKKGVEREGRRRHGFSLTAQILLCCPVYCHVQLFTGCIPTSPSAVCRCSCRTSATASTWSLTRLDALAAEVVDTLTALDNAHQHATIPTPPSEQCAGASTSAADAAGQSGSAAAGSTAGVAGSGSSSSSDNSNGAHIRNSQQQSAAAGFAAVRQQAQRYPMQVLDAVNAVLFQRHGYSACNRYAPCCCCLLAESNQLMPLESCL